MNNFEKRIKLSYKQRAELTENKLTKKIFRLMEEKETNLCVSIDVTNAAKFFSILNEVAEHIFMVKTHIDIIDDFNPDFIKKLKIMAKKHNFLIFEDRKFADIGKTVQLQYSSGIYKIASWADMVNAHSVPGEGIIQGLQVVADEIENARGCLLLAQMTSKGTLATGDYTKKTVELANRCKSFVSGFIGSSQEKELKMLASIADPGFLIFTPGVNLDTTKGKLLQQYTTPEQVINHGSDIIIVGSGISKAEKPKEKALLYRKEA